MEDFSGPIRADLGEEAEASSREYYDITLLHQGSVFDVYLGSRLGKLWALKVCREKGDAIAAALLRREFELSHCLSHPFIASSFCMEDTPVGLAVVMEYFDGVPLDEYVTHQHSLSQRLRLFENILDAVAYLHSKELIHNDIKPSNILVTPGGYPKIIDFGFSDAAVVFKMKTPGCSVRWASPELREKGVSNELGDIYSLGKLGKLLLPEKRFRHTLNRAVGENPDSRWRTVPQFKQALEKDAKRPGSVFLALAAVLVVAAAFLSVAVMVASVDAEVARERAIRDSLQRERFVKDSLRQVCAESARATIQKISDSIEREESVRKVQLEDKKENVLAEMQRMYDRWESVLDTCSGAGLRLFGTDRPSYLFCLDVAAYRKAVKGDRDKESYCNRLADEMVSRLQEMEDRILSSGTE